jgi:hypothetical protein
MATMNKRCLSVCGILLLAVVAPSLSGVLFARLDVKGRIKEATKTEHNGGMSLFQPLVFNAGHVMDGDLVRAVFIFTNHAGQTVKIRDIRSTCSCSVIHVDTPLELPPLASIRIPVEVEAAGSQGEFSKSVAYVEMADNPPVPLIVKGNLINGFPRRVDFGDVRRGDRVARGFVVRSLPGSSINVKDVEYDGSLFDVEHIKDPDNESCIKFKVRLRDEVGFGPFRKELTIRTDEERKPEKRILLQGYVLGRLETSTKRIFLGTMADDVSALTGEIDILCPYGDHISKLEVKSSDDSILTYRVSETGPARKKVYITVKKKNGVQGVGLLSERLSIRAEIDRTPYVVEVAVLAISK